MILDLEVVEQEVGRVEVPVAQGQNRGPEKQGVIITIIAAAAAAAAAVGVVVSGGGGEGCKGRGRREG
jgi:hypothetical protein